VLGPDDLVLCAGTLLPTPLVERAAAARDAGFTGMSLWLSDVVRARRDGMSGADVGRLFDDHGLEVAEIDCLTTWLPGSGAPAGTPLSVENAMRAAEDEFFAAADAVGGRSLNLVDLGHHDAPLDAVVEAFAGVCDRAAGHGLLVHLEFLPWSGFPDLHRAWDVVRLADRPNGGLLVDSWHCARSATTLDDLAAVPGDRVLAVQLSDAVDTPADKVAETGPVDIRRETMHGRLLPGDGIGRVAEIVATLDRIGSTAPIGVEVFSDELWALAPADAARRAADATRAVLATARGG
jgi:sugar phosphate isomerase/epimerase